MARIQLNQLIGRFVVNKYRSQCTDQGAFQSARNLRKQGYPLALALLLIVGRV